MRAWEVPACDYVLHRNSETQQLSKQPNLNKSDPLRVYHVGLPLATPMMRHM